MEQSFEREVLDRLKTIEIKIEKYSDIVEKTQENERDIVSINNSIGEFEKRISSLEESNKWLSRTITGAIIAAIVGLVIVVFRAGAGI